MGKFYETTSTFNYSWEKVACALWNRYPNPFSTHVLSEDTLCREIRKGEPHHHQQPSLLLYSKRILTKTNRVPSWGQKLIKQSLVTIVEESYVDPDLKTVTTYTRNIGQYTRIMSITEKVTYSPDSSDPSGQTTLARRSAWVDSSLFGFRRAIEKFGVERFRSNCGQAVRGLVYVLEKLYPNNNNKVQGSSSSVVAANNINKISTTTVMMTNTSSSSLTNSHYHGLLVGGERSPPPSSGKSLKEKAKTAEDYFAIKDNFGVVYAKLLRNSNNNNTNDQHQQQQQGSDS